MAQDYVGSNNLAYFYQDGQFGTRLEGGKDAAAARYIFTRLERHTRLIFREEDDPVLTYASIDGHVVEPEWYVPIIPMLLVNGCSGIGTGWSSDIPCFNPADIISWIRVWIEKRGEIKERVGSVDVYNTPDVTPWYKGFTGTITVEEDRVVTKGVVKQYAKKKNSFEITELPIGVWTNKYKNQVEDWYEAKSISYRANYSTVDKVHFVVTPEESFDMSEKNLKLTSYLSMNNMVAFDTNKAIHRYKHVEDILEEFCRVRLDLYEKRKTYQLDQLRKQIQTLSNKIRFLTAVMEQKLVIFHVPEQEIVKRLTTDKYDTEDGTFQYLLQLPIQSFTKEKIQQLTQQCEKTKASHQQLRGMEESQIWLRELDELQEAL